MDKQLIITGILAASFLVLFGTAEILYHKMKIKAELTRKFVHVGTGALTLLFPVLLDNHWYVLFLCASFAGILLLSLRFNLLKSINAIDRESHGSISYPVAIYGCYLFFSQHRDADPGGNGAYLFFYLPVLMLAVCDPVAALFGKRWPLGPYRVSGGNKSMLGSAMFFVSAVILCTALGYAFSGTRTEGFILLSVIISFAGTIAEALSGKGLDNLTIPGVGVLVMYIMYDVAHLFHMYPMN
ncbi:MAG: phosphatidate cytidylyltransferase [Bacteroidetes bacterium]|nr:MAG: phosphatidate cytidylyltransferase [Bacteroidota bacterium]